MNRKIYYWKLRDSEMQLGERTLIMGVLNLTPDSFSDGGRFNDPDRAYARALEMEEQGVDIIDIGAESTRPGSQRISADEEWQRLVPVLKRLKGNLRAPLSLDTYKSEIAERAVQYGVEIFNDPSGLTYDPGLAKVAANNNSGLILNHMRGQPETWSRLPPMQDPLGTVARDLDATVNRARHAGVDRARIVIDPGLGFGKRKEQNAEILAHLKQLAALDYPILIGASRKSFLSQATESDTTFATAAAVTAAVLNGAHIVRVHDVKEMQSVILVADEIAHAAGIQSRPAEEERLARTQKSVLFEDERAQPARPPLAKPVPVEARVEAQPEVKAPEPPAVPKPIFKPAKPAKSDGGGFAPPVRRAPQDGRNQKGGPPRRDFRPGGPRPFDRKGDKPQYERRDVRPPAAGRSDSGPPRRDFRSDGPPRGGPPRSFDSRSDSRGERRGDSKDRGDSGRGGPPSRGDRPDRSGPPKRPFRKRP